MKRLNQRSLACSSILIVIVLNPKLTIYSRRINKSLLFRREVRKREGEGSDTTTPNLNFCCHTMAADPVSIAVPHTFVRTGNKSHQTIQCVLFCQENSAIILHIALRDAVWYICGDLERSDRACDAFSRIYNIKSSSCVRFFTNNCLLLCIFCTAGGI